MINTTRFIHIVTISGSAQRENNTEKALALVHDELDRMVGIRTIQILPRMLNLAIPGSAMDASDRSSLQEMVKDADGIILATPEYHGSFSSLMKLTIENMGFPSVLKGKPVSLLGVAAGRIGAVKSLEHLRSVCSHVGALVLPGSVSVAGVRTIFDQSGRCLDPIIESNIRKIPQRLVKYISDTICPDRSFEEMIRNDAGVERE